MRSGSHSVKAALEAYTHIWVQVGRGKGRGVLGEGMEAKSLGKNLK